MSRRPDRTIPHAYLALEQAAKIANGKLRPNATFLGAGSSRSGYVADIDLPNREVASWVALVPHPEGLDEPLLTPAAEAQLLRLLESHSLPFQTPGGAVVVDTERGATLVVEFLA